MAQRALTVTNPNQNVLRVAALWSSAAGAVLNGDTTDSVEIDQYDATSVQVSGTPGAGLSVVVELSQDNVTFWAARNNAGTAITFTAVGGDCLAYESRAARYARARVAGGDGTTALTVSFLCTK